MIWWFNMDCIKLSSQGFVRESNRRGSSKSMSFGRSLVSSSSITELVSSFGWLHYGLFFLGFAYKYLGILPITGWRIDWLYFYIHVSFKEERDANLFLNPGLWFDFVAPRGLEFLFVLGKFSKPSCSLWSDWFVVKSFAIWG